MGKKLLVAIALAVLVASAVYMGTEAFVRRKVEEDISRMVSAMSSVESLDYEKLEVGFLGSWLRFKDVSLKARDLDEKIRVDRVDIPEYRLEGDELVGLQLRLEKLRLPSKFFSDEPETGAPAGKESRYAVAELSLEYAYDPALRKMNVKNFSVVSRSLGVARIQLTLDNIEPSGISLENPAASMPSLFGASIARAEVSYLESSALKRILRNQDGTPSEAMRFLTKAVNREIGRAKRNEASPKVLEALVKIRRFLIKPEKIRIAASPVSPVPLGRFFLIRSAADVINILNLEVEL
jgi:hypothetical protein